MPMLAGDNNFMQIANSVYVADRPMLTGNKKFHANSAYILSYGVIGSFLLRPWIMPRIYLLVNAGLWAHAGNKKLMGSIA